MPGPSQISCPFFPTGFFRAGFFSGHPGTLTCIFSLITFDVAMFIFSYMSNTPELNRIVWDTQRSDSQEVRSRET